MLWQLMESLAADAAAEERDKQEVEERRTRCKEKDETMRIGKALGGVATPVHVRGLHWGSWS